MDITRFCRILSCAVVASALIVAPAVSHAVAFTTAPSFKIGTAALISPSAADAYYGAATTATNSTGATARPNEVVEWTSAFGGNVDAIYAYVRDNIEISWMYGLQKGPIGTIIDRSGTSFDQAQLFVELLREAGHTASYIAGTMTLSGSEWRDWSGLTDAKSTCQLLSSGGIPASINGSVSANCDYAGAVSSVTLAHIWVKVRIGIADYIFDPSYKPHIFKTGINISAAAGLASSGEALSQTTVGMGTGTVSNVPWIRNLNSEALAARLQAYGTNLLAYIQANAPAGEIEDIVGGAEIRRFVAPAGGLRQAASPFPHEIQRTWTGNIPDQYRTSMRVQIGKFTPASTGSPIVIVDELLYVDEIYGRKLIVDTNFDFSSSVVQLKLVDGGGAGVTLGSYSGSERPTYNIGGEITLTVSHPYAASASGSAATGGNYMDVTVRKLGLRYWTPLTIVHGWGDIGKGLVASWRSRQDRELVPTPVTCMGETCETAFAASAGDGRREQIAAAWLTQFSQAARLHAAIAKGIFTHHHSLGVVAADSYMHSTPYGLGNVMLSIIDSFDRVDVESGFSLTSTTAQATDRRAALHAIAATGEALEGSAAGQIADMPDISSTATRFDWGNRPPAAEDLSGGYGPRRFYSFDAGNAAQALGLLRVEGKTSGTNPGLHPGNVEPVINGSEFSARVGAVSDLITSYVQAGFSVLAAEDAFLGPGQRGGAYIKENLNQYFHVTSRQRGGAVIATRYSGADPVEIAHVIVAEDVNAKGGGSGAQPTHDAQYDPARSADLLKARFVDRSSALGVDLKTGKLTYESPASLSVGSGGFPYQLDAKVLWTGGQVREALFGPILHTEPQTPWTTNWNNTATFSSSALELMYDGDVRATAGTLAAFLAVQDIYKQSVTAQRDAAGALVNAWWLRQIQNNVVTVSVGVQTRQFVRLVDPSQWIQVGLGPFARLTQTGTRVPFTEQICGSATGPTYVTSRGWNDSGVSLKVTNAQGDEQNFSFWRTQYREGGAGTMCAYQHGFRLTSWVFPQGVNINLVYANDSFGMPRLAEVNNNLGRKIRFVNGGPGGFDNGLSGADARSISIIDGLLSVDSTAKHTDPDGKLTKIQFRIAGGEYLLERVFTADNPTVPALQYDYDSLQRVREVRDAVALRTGGRNPYQFFLATGGLAERIDPAGGRLSVFLDRHDRAVGFADEVDRRTWVEYDGRSRPTRYVYPENDEQRLTYDDRNNITRLVKVAKPCTSTPCTTPQLTTEASWHPLWNKPTWIRDARLKQTDFAYYESGNGRSLLSSATRPSPDGTAPRPVYSFTYNAFGQVVDATDPTGLVIRSGYHPTNGDRTSITLDPSGLNATTLLGYDALGNLASETNPRGNAEERIYDKNRRLTTTLHHNGGLAAGVIAAERTIYDELGRVVRQEAGTAFSGTTVTAWQAKEITTYTPTSKVYTVTNGAGNTTSYSYDPVDRVRQITDPQNRRKRYEYDLAGQMVTEIRGYGSALQQNYATYTYTLNGQRRTVKDANDNLGTFEYDGFDRLAKLRFPVASKGQNRSSELDLESYSYDENGNRTGLRRRDERQITFTYDALNRQTLKHFPADATQDVYSGYDLAGRPQYVRLGSASGSGVEYGYDSAKRLTSEVSYGRTMQLGYDVAHNRNLVVWPDGDFVSYSFDALNRMTEVRENSMAPGSGVIATYGYDAFSRRASITRANGTPTGFGYDAASRLARLQQDFAGAAQDLTLDFGYSLASQLERRTSSNAAFDWTTLLPTRTYQINGLNQYRFMDGTTYSYDRNGNLTSDGSRTFNYDIENRLTSVSGSVSLTLAYDPTGRLRQTSGSATTQFLYVGNQLVAEYDGAGAVIRRYVHGPGVDDPLIWYEGGAFNNKQWLHADERGSIIATSDSSGAASPYIYGPYGEPTAWTGSRFRYTGQLALHEVNLYYYKARIYDPVQGRFLQTDPHLYKDDVNLYAYVNNDPLNSSDPTGTERYTTELEFERDKGPILVGKFADKAQQASAAAHLVAESASLVADRAPIGRGAVPLATMVGAEKASSTLGKVSSRATLAKAGIEAASGEGRAAVTTLTAAAVDKGVGMALGTTAAMLIAPELAIPTALLAEGTSSFFEFGQEVSSLAVNAAFDSVNEAVGELKNATPDDKTIIRSFMCFSAPGQSRFCSH